MLKSLAIAAIFLSAPSFAGHLDTVCEKAVNQSIVWEDNLIAYRDSGESLITTYEGTIIASAPVAIRGVIQDGLSIWTLTPRQLVELNSAGDVLNTYWIEETGNPMWQALSMVKANGKIIITRGVGGMIGFDLTKREIAWTNWMPGDDEGYPSGVAFDGEKVYAAVATSQENGFTGVITVNPENGNIERRSRYDVARWGVIDTDAKARMHGDALILNNGGWIHLITKKQIESDKAIRPRWVAQVIPQNGAANAHYLMIKGEFMVHDGFVMACGIYSADENGSIVRKSKLFHVKLP